MKKPDEPHTIEIRKANRADAECLFLMIKGLAAYHDDIASISLETLERDMSGDRPWVHILIAKIDGKAIGYSALCPLMQLQFGVRGMDMHHLFVESGFRGRGVGRALIQASLSLARDLSCSYMMVGTHPDNVTAQAAYIACGFERRDSSGPRFRISLVDR